MAHAIQHHRPRLHKVASTGNKMSSELQDFIKRCLHKKPEQRPTAAELLAHPWIEKHTSSAAGLASRELRLFWRYWMHYPKQPKQLVATKIKNFLKWEAESGSSGFSAAAAANQSEGPQGARNVLAEPTTSDDSCNVLRPCDSQLNRKVDADGNAAGVNAVSDKPPRYATKRRAGKENDVTREDVDQCRKLMSTQSMPAAAAANAQHNEQSAAASHLSPLEDVKPPSDTPSSSSLTAVPVATADGAAKPAADHQGSIRTAVAAIAAAVAAAAAAVPKAIADGAVELEPNHQGSIPMTAATGSVARSIHSQHGDVQSLQHSMQQGATAHTGISGTSEHAAVAGAFTPVVASQGSVECPADQINSPAAVPCKPSTTSDDSMPVPVAEPGVMDITSYARSSVADDADGNDSAVDSCLPAAVSARQGVRSFAIDFSDVTSHPISFDDITSHPISFDDITSHPISFDDITSHPLSFDDMLSDDEDDSTVADPVVEADVVMSSDNDSSENDAALTGDSSSDAISETASVDSSSTTTTTTTTSSSSSSLYEYVVECVKVELSSWSWGRWLLDNYDVASDLYYRCRG
eukprot:jgi/Chrzof1/907/Cz01g33050.t1